MIRPLTIVQTGDLHLGSPFTFAADKANLLQRTQMEVFVAIIQLCQQMAADVLLIAGDLFDQPVPDPGLVRIVRELFAGLLQTKVLIAPGNHDPAALDSPYIGETWPPQVVIFSDSLAMVEWPEHQVRIYGCGFTATVATQPLPLAPAGGLDPAFTNLCLLHGELEGLFGSPYNPIAAADLARVGYDYVALGHSHSFSGFLGEGSTTYAYAGCPFGRGFDETGDKGVIVGTIRQAAPLPSLTQPTRPMRPVLNLAFQPLGGRKFLEQRIDLTGCTDIHQAATRVVATLQADIGDGFAEHLYKLVLVGTLESDSRASVPVLSQLLAGRLFWFRIIDATRRSLDLDSLAREHSLQGAFVRLAQTALRQAAESGQTKDQLITQKALELGLAAMRGEEVWHETDPA